MNSSGAKLGSQSSSGQMTGRHLLIMAAGTGGHVIPGLAVAREMQSRGWQVTWLGTPAGLENKLVPPSGIPLEQLNFTGLRGKGGLHTFTGVFRLLGAFWKAWRLIASQRVDAVLGMGGYVCFPGGLAAWLRRKPLTLVNADAAWLMSNRALKPFAHRIAFGFDGEDARQCDMAVATGNPVRADIEALPEPALRWQGRQGPLRLLVLGGSLGAQVLNQTVPAALAQMPVAVRPIVTHQTGATHIDDVRARYATLGVEGEVLPFIDNMAERLAAADLVVCRAGAITVSELCAAGVPSILVPLVVSTTSHQRDNAAWMASRGASLHLPQTDLNPQHLADILRQLSREGLLKQAQAALALKQPHAAVRVADLIELTSKRELAA